MGDQSPQDRASLPRNVKILGLTSLLNDVASEMAYPLVPQFLVTMLGGTPLVLGTIEGLAESVSSLVKLWSGGRSDRVRSRKGLVLFGYALGLQVEHMPLAVCDFDKTFFSSLKWRNIHRTCACSSGSRARCFPLAS